MIWSKSIKTCKSSEIRRKRISVECHCLRSISADLQLVAQPCRVFDARRLPAAPNGIALVKRELIKWQMAPANGLPSSRYSSPKLAIGKRLLAQAGFPRTNGCHSARRIPWRGRVGSLPTGIGPDGSSTIPLGVARWRMYYSGSTRLDFTRAI